LNTKSTLAAAATAMMMSGGAWAAESVTLTLNWTPTADHAPYYYAKAQGWYEEAGIDLTIETGRGSGTTAQRVGVGAVQFGIADMATALVARSKGADLVAVMSVYANTPQGFYWLKSSGIEGPKDFVNHSIGNPPGDASRVMWPAFAAAAGIDPLEVSFVNISPQAKMPSLKSGAVDIISDFYNEHDLKVQEFGDDLGYVSWRDVGLNPYGNSVLVNGAYLAENRGVVADFVRITQKAFATCVEDVTPCLDALLGAVTGLDEPTQRNQWNRIKELMTDDFTTTVALGWFDADRMADDYNLVETYFGLDQPFEVTATYTTEFLDQSLRMPK
jgi:NitT/TauT family transport system substrate-binding protein